MMPLTEIDRLKQTVAGSWDSPVADQVAARWGYPAGTAKWWRSSASHVFVLPEYGRGGRRFLRFVPAAYRERADVAAAAGFMAQLSRGGSAVVRPVAAGSGALTGTVPTPIGAMHAMMAEAAPGEEADIAGLTVPRARGWGQALARLHRDATGLGTGLGEAFGELPGVADLFADDTALVKATLALSGWMGSLPRDEHHWGWCTAISSWTTWPGPATGRSPTTSTRPRAPGSPPTSPLRCATWLTPPGAPQVSTGTGSARSLPDTAVFAGWMTRIWAVCRCSPGCTPRLGWCGLGARWASLAGASRTGWPGFAAS